MGSDRKLHVLRDLGRIVTGKTPKTAVDSYFNGVTPFVTPTDFDGRRWIGKTLRTLTSSGVDAVRSSLVPAESVMVTCIGSDMGKVAMSAVASVTNQQINTLVVSPEHDARYVYYNLLGRRAELRALAAGSAQPILNKSSFGMIEIELPACPDQCAVADVLSALDDRIDLLRQTNTALEAIAQALFKSWFVDFDPVHAKVEGREPEAMDAATAALFPSEFEESELGSIPKGWRSATSGAIYEIGIGKTPPRKEQHWFTDSASDVAWASIRDMGAAGVFLTSTSEFLTREAMEKFNVRMVPEGSVLMSFKLTVGRVAIADFDMTTNEAIAHFKSKQGSLPQSFLYCFLKSFDMNSLSSTSSIANATNSKAIRSMPILYPGLELAQKFDTFAGPLLERIKMQQRQMLTLESLRDTLLSRLISGKLRLPDATKPAEEAIA